MPRPIDSLKPLADIKAIYGCAIAPFEKMEKYYPHSRIQVWKAAYNEFLVLDSLEFRGILIHGYPLALQVKADIEISLESCIHVQE